MPKEYSPFTPGVPVPIDFFVGRLPELDLMVRCIKQVVSGKQENIFLIGERGIGKSSLASFTNFLAQKGHEILSVHVFLGGVNTLEEMVRRIFERLLKESVNTPWHQNLRQFFGKHIREVGLFGISIEFAATPEDLRNLVQDFVPALRNLMEKLKDEKKGLLVALDDINGLATNPDFANWYKSVIDEIATSQKPLPLLLMLIGLPERRDSLIKSQPSLNRVFSIVEIKALSESETKEFYSRTFRKVEVPFDTEAINLMWRFSGGLPMLIHEIGDAVFWIDTDNHIDPQDALKGIVASAEIVGRKHLDPKVYRVIRSDRYRAILKKVAKEPFQSSFHKHEIEGKLSQDERKVFHNFLRRMKELGVLISEQEGVPGAYRFANRLYPIYMYLFSERGLKNSRRDT